MPDEHVEANIEAVITATCRHRNPALGPFINRAVLMTIPGESFFAIDTSHWHPEPTESQIKLIERRKKKKKAKDSEADDATKIVISETGKQIVDPRITDPLFDVM
jgi:hypothetical protein